MVVSVKIEEAPLEAYNLTVEGFHTYAVGYLNAQVHNDCREVPQHVFDGHVGKDDSFLVRRHQNEGLKVQASTFTLQQSAQSLTNSVLDSAGGQADITRFLSDANGPRRLILNSDALDLSFSSATGRTVIAGSRQSQAASGVRVVIQRDDTIEEGFRIVSSFPRRD